jgi:cell division protein FtsB
VVGAETVDKREQAIAEETARIIAEAVKPEIEKLAASIDRLEQTSKRLADGVDRAYARAGQQGQ